METKSQNFRGEQWEADWNTEDSHLHWTTALKTRLTQHESVSCYFEMHPQQRKGGWINSPFRYLFVLHDMKYMCGLVSPISLLFRASFWSLCPPLPALSSSEWCEAFRRLENKLSSLVTNEAEMLTLRNKVFIPSTNVHIAWNARSTEKHSF